MSDIPCTLPLPENRVINNRWQEGLPAKGNWRSLSALSQHVWHPVYQCEIYCWLALGTVLVDRCHREPQYFLYCEYRDCTASSQYVVYSFSSLSGALNFRQRVVVQQVLPEISPDQTRKHPISVC